MGTSACHCRLKEGFADVSPLSENCAAGAAEAIEAVKALITSGEWDVFSAADNIWMSKEKPGLFLKKECYAEIEDMAGKFGFEIDPRKK